MCIEEVRHRFRYGSINQVEDIVLPNVAASESQQGPMLQSVIDALVIGIGDVRGQRPLRHFFSQILVSKIKATKLRANHLSQMENIGDVARLADQVIEGVYFSGIGNRKSNLYVPLSGSCRNKPVHRGDCFCWKYSGYKKSRWIDDR